MWPNNRSFRSSPKAKARTTDGDPETSSGRQVGFRMAEVSGYGGILLIGVFGKLLP